MSSQNPANEEQESERLYAIVRAMPLQVIIRYEIEAAGWPQYVSWPWAQSLAGWYFARKAQRIQRRFRRAVVRAALVKAMGAGFAKGGPTPGHQP